MRSTRALLAVACLLGAQVTPAAAQEGRGPRATIAGTVWDSLSWRPMAGAVVQLAQFGEGGRVVDTRSTPTDSLGRYEFQGVPLGAYLLGFQHLALDTLGFRAPVHRVAVREPGDVKVPLGVPGMTTIVRTVCGPRTVPDSLSLLVGSVRMATSDATVAGAFVSVKWAELTLGRGGILRDIPTRDMQATDEGWYSACVPAGVPLTAYAQQDSLRSGDVTVTLSTNVVRRRDLYLGVAQVAIASGDSLSRTGVVEGANRLVTTGSGQVRGRVLGRGGRPLANARVALVTGTAEAITDEDGRFTLRNVPLGTYGVEARAIGYFPEEATVDIVTFREAPVELSLVALSAAQLDTVRIAARSGLEAATRASWERRKVSGVGWFLDDNVLDTLKVNTFSEILRQVPGVTFVEGQGANDRFERRILMQARGGMSGMCMPSLYIDGIRLLQGPTDFDQLINAASIRRIEVYRSGLTIPAEFFNNDGCGVIAVWLGPIRRPRPPGK